MEVRMADHALTNVRGVGPRTADGLAALGIDSIETLAAAPSELIATLPGFSLNRAEAVKIAARELLRADLKADRAAAKTAKKKAKKAGKKKDKKPGKDAAKKKKKKKAGKKDRKDRKKK
jgi:F0F1-type ATP synthase epsilon subunit